MYKSAKKRVKKTVRKVKKVAKGGRFVGKAAKKIGKGADKLTGGKVGKFLRQSGLGKVGQGIINTAPQRVANRILRGDRIKKILVKTL